MIQKLFVPGVMPGLNEVINSAKGAGGSGAHYYRLKDTLTSSVMILARTARPRLVPMESAHFHYTFRELHRKRDPSNIFVAVKFIEDGLVAAGVFKNDGWDQVLSIRMNFEVVDKKSAGVLVTMESPE